jgi:transposase
MLSGSARERSGKLPRTRPPYPPEFRQEAVRLLRSGARSTKQLAAELGCSPQTLSNWVRLDEADRGERDDVLSSEERQRLRELERENKVLRQEREILKRGRGFLCQGDRSTVTRFRYVDAEGRTVSRLPAVPGRGCDASGPTTPGSADRPADASSPTGSSANASARSTPRPSRSMVAPRTYSELKLVDGIKVGKKRVAPADASARHPRRRRSAWRLQDDGPRSEAALGSGSRRPRLRASAGRCATTFKA